MAITFIRNVFVHMSVVSVLLISSSVASAQQCTYKTWSWNVQQKKAVNYHTVNKDKRELASFERDAVTGCSVCEQDQLEIRLANLKPFKVCKRLAQKVTTNLRNLIEQGEAIKSVIGYRVGLTRGPVDRNGNRSQFSNHSFGIAIDINTDHNGLYTNCFQFGPECKKLRGGDWRPDVDPLSLKPNSKIVNTLKRMGLKWGGEIAGRQKDFMHFSITGY